MKVMLSVAIYLAIVFVLGIVMSLTAPRESCEQKRVDDNF